MAPLALALAALLLLPASGLARQDAEALRMRGIELGFNLDHAEAVAVFRESIAADPNHLAGYRLVAAALWTHALFQAGAVTAGDFTGEAGSSFRRPASSDLESAVAEVKRRADALAKSHERRGSRPDVDTAFQVGAAYRLLCSYAVTTDGSQWQGLTTARRAYREHERVLALDPRRADAGLTVGLYRYWVSTQRIWSRVIARVAGLDNDRDQGIRLVEAAAAHESADQASAMFSLIVIYNQTRRYADALRVIGELQRRFPRNRLLWLEEGITALRAGTPSIARTALEHGIQMLEHDPRPRAPGELARWRYHYGVSLSRLGQHELAAEQFRLADGDKGK